MIFSKVDRRCFDLSRVMYESMDAERIRDAPTYGTSLEAARSVLQKNSEKSLAPPEDTATQRKIALAQTVEAQEQWSRPCANCDAQMFTKHDWTRYNHRYYCVQCIEKVVAADEFLRPCEGPGCNAQMNKRQWNKFNHGYYCIQCYNDYNWAN